MTTESLVLPKKNNRGLRPMRPAATQCTSSVLISPIKHSRVPPNPRGSIQHTAILSHGCNEVKSVVNCPWWKALAAALQAANEASSGPGVSRTSVLGSNGLPCVEKFLKFKANTTGVHGKSTNLRESLRNKSKSVMLSPLYLVKDPII